MNHSVADTRRDAILSAALHLIETQGTGAWPLADLARETGLSRPAIYQYFASREHILGELIVNEIADLSNEIERVVAQHTDPLEQLRVWLHYSFTHVASEKHRLMSQISVSRLPDELRGELTALHGFFLTSLVSPLTKLGVPHPLSHAHLIFASVDAAAQRIQAGKDFATEAAVLERFVIAGVEQAITDGAPGTG